MRDLVIELILLATIIVPLVTDTFEPYRTVDRHGPGRRRKLGGSR